MPNDYMPRARALVAAWILFAAGACSNSSTSPDAPVNRADSPMADAPITAGIDAPRPDAATGDSPLAFDASTQPDANTQPDASTVDAPPPPTSFDNPVITDRFLADPGARVFGDTVYVYAGHDTASLTDLTYIMNDWQILSSKDMTHWEEHGPGLTPSTFAWSTGRSWASDVIERDGKFFWYVTTEYVLSDHVSHAMGVGVAVGDSPTGPFHDAIGAPLIAEVTDPSQIPGAGNPKFDFRDIDPAIFIDDDGQAYLYFGNTTMKYVKLKADMITVDGGINIVTVPNAGAFPFTEASYLHKHNGRYYLSYASKFSEQTVYSYGDSPTGPWTFGGIILDYGANSKTNHHAIIDFNGASYIVYHTGAAPQGGEYRRSLCVDRLYYNVDGTIATVVPTFTPRAGQRIQSFNFQDLHYTKDPPVDGTRGSHRVRLDNGVAPFVDAEWKIVPGLANPSDPSLVSFQSVSDPTQYIRHFAFIAYVETDDHSAGFAGDATFKKVPGFADPTWTSFQSYNFPDHYLRHFAFLLRADVPPDPLDAFFPGDSTFRIIP